MNVHCSHGNVFVLSNNHFDQYNVSPVGDKNAKNPQMNIAEAAAGTDLPV